MGLQAADLVTSAHGCGVDPVLCARWGILHPVATEPSLELSVCPHLVVPLSTTCVDTLSRSSIASSDVPSCSNSQGIYRVLLSGACW